MKYLFYLSLAILIFSSCGKSFIQIFEAAAINVETKNDYYVFESDTLRITYAFWTSKGVMSYSVYNKSDKPIYIDWKNSSFIYNGNKLNYWSEEFQTISQSTAVSKTNKNTNISSYYNGYYYVGSPIIWGFANNQSYISSNSLTTTQTETHSSTFKPERVTFIPPKSTYSCSRFYLLPVDYYKLNTKTISRTNAPRNDSPGNVTKVYEEKFDFSNSPLVFRNYLAFSFTENSANYFFIDNEFYLTSVKEMDYRHYRGKYLGKDENGGPIYEKPFKKPKNFYINIDGVNTVEYRSGMYFK